MANKCHCEESAYGIAKGWIDWKIYAKHPMEASTVQLVQRCPLCNADGKIPLPKTATWPAAKTALAR